MSLGSSSSLRREQQHQESAIYVRKLVPKKRTTSARMVKLLTITWIFVFIISSIRTNAVHASSRLSVPMEAQGLEYVTITGEVVKPDHPTHSKIYASFQKNLGLNHHQ